MIKSFELVNFRKFKNASVEDCRRINIIVGKNASGKTSFLEGVFLTLNVSPEPVFRMRQWRGIDVGVVQGQVSTVNRAVWGDLFHDFEKKSIHLISRGDDVHERHLTIEMNQTHVSVDAADIKNSWRFGGISFKWKSKRERDVEIKPVIGLNGFIQLPDVFEPLTQSFFYAANHPYSSVESASRLSDLSKISKIDEFVEVFRKQYPSVEDLSVELLCGVPLIYAKMIGIENKIPLAMISGGMNKLASVLLAFPTAPNSIILIDEVENGFYYKDMPEIWQVFLMYAKRYNAQIFASTHSGECLSAAAMVAKSDQDQFSVIHAENGKLRQFQGDKFVWADEENIEIR